VPDYADQWQWSCGFYPVSHRGEREDGTAPDFFKARADFGPAWSPPLQKITDADLVEFRRERAWVAWKYRMWDWGCKLPTQEPNGQSRCFCGAEIDVAGVSHHVYAAHSDGARSLMGWKFFGYAAVFGSPDRDNDVFASGCFGEFLQKPDHLSIPMLNGHVPELSIGHWKMMAEDGFGLLVHGEFNDELVGLSPPYPGLSVKVINAQGSNSNNWGGKLARRADIQEISVVASPAHPNARILGTW
jgi:hypothetical protein